jgi:hypothetical protein
LKTDTTTHTPIRLNQSLFLQLHVSMSELITFILRQQSDAYQVYLILTTSTLLWCLLRHLFTTRYSLMARSRKGALKNDAGQPGVITAKSTRKKYTSAVRSGLLQSIMASMSLSSPPPPEIKESLQPAARQVFDTPELLAMILALLPLNTNRNALLVCRSFSQCMHPRAERHLYGIKEALGIKHPRAIRSIIDLSGSQQREIKVQPRNSYVERPLRLDWLFNIGFEDNRPPNMLRQRSETYLEIAPFVVGSIKGSLEDGCVRVYLRLDCRDVEKDVARKGVGKLRGGEYEQYSNRAPNGVRYSFLDIKVLKEPFNLRVAVRVDFRKAMQASSSHAQGPCPIPGCQVGLYGRQVCLLAHLVAVLVTLLILFSHRQHSAISNRKKQP